ncbi:MAG TPA: helix-turn-helix transcriptional regulator [Chitinophagaceae bacterium]|nr:helix-turn-helix transcriptional regulator [Chitinophagaceae bacterium]
MLLSIQIEFVELSSIDILRYLHFSLCFIGAVLLFITWKKRSALIKDESNYGILFISLALILWCAMDLYRILGIMKPGQVSILLKIFSSYNNALFLASLPYFTKCFYSLREKVPFFRNSTQWVILVLIANIFMVLLYSLFWSDQGITNSLVKNIDVLYSVCTFSLIGYALILSFYRTEGIFKGYYYVSWFLGVILILPQIFFFSFFEITHFEIISIALLISQYLLVVMVLILEHFSLVQNLFVSEQKDHQNFELLEEKTKNEKMKLEEQLISLSGQIEKLNKQNFDLQNEVELCKSQTTQLGTLQILTEREKEILKHIDKSYTEIGTLLFISRDTVITHKKNIMAKLGTQSKEELVDLAKKFGLID